MHGVGYFGSDQLAALQQLAQPLRNDGHIMLAVCHHHLLPVWPSGSLSPSLDPRQGPPPEISHTVDGIELLNLLAELAFTAVLHGHQHFPALLSYSNLWWQRPPLAIAASGSCGLKGTRHFFVLDVDDEQVTATSFSNNPLNPHLYTRDAGRPVIRLPVV